MIGRSKLNMQHTIHDNTLTTPITFVNSFNYSVIIYLKLKVRDIVYEYLYSPGNPVATKKEKNKHTNLIK